MSHVYVCAEARTGNDSVPPLDIVEEMSQGSSPPMPDEVARSRAAAQHVNRFHMRSFPLPRAAVEALLDAEAPTWRNDVPFHARGVDSVWARAWAAAAYTTFEELRGFHASNANLAPLAGGAFAWHVSRTCRDDAPLLPQISDAHASNAALTHENVHHVRQHTREHGREHACGHTGTREPRSEDCLPFHLEMVWQTMRAAPPQLQQLLFDDDTIAALNMYATAEDVTRAPSSTEKQRRREGGAVRADAAWEFDATNSVVRRGVARLTWVHSSSMASGGGSGRRGPVSVDDDDTQSHATRMSAGSVGSDDSESIGSQEADAFIARTVERVQVNDELDDDTEESESEHEGGAFASGPPPPAPHAAVRQFMSDEEQMEAETEAAIAAAARESGFDHAGGHTSSAPPPPPSPPSVVRSGDDGAQHPPTPARMSASVDVVDEAAHATQPHQSQTQHARQQTRADVDAMEAEAESVDDDEKEHDASASTVLARAVDEGEQETVCNTLSQRVASLMRVNIGCAVRRGGTWRTLQRALRDTSADTSSPFILLPTTQNGMHFVHALHTCASEAAAWCERADTLPLPPVSQRSTVYRPLALLTCIMARATHHGILNASLEGAAGGGDVPHFMLVSSLRSLARDVSACGMPLDTCHNLLQQSLVTHMGMPPDTAAQLVRSTRRNDVTCVVARLSPDTQQVRVLALVRCIRATSPEARGVPVAHLPSGSAGEQEGEEGEKGSVSTRAFPPLLNPDSTWVLANAVGHPFAIVCALLAAWLSAPAAITHLLFPIFMEGVTAHAAALAATLHGCFGASCVTHNAHTLCAHHKYAAAVFGEGARVAAHIPSPCMRAVLEAAAGEHASDDAAAEAAVKTTPAVEAATDMVAFVWSRPNTAAWVGAAQCLATQVRASARDEASPPDADAVCAGAANIDATDADAVDADAVDADAQERAQDNATLPLHPAIHDSDHDLSSMSDVVYKGGEAEEHGDAHSIVSATVSLTLCDFDPSHASSPHHAVCDVDATETFDTAGVHASGEAESEENVEEEDVKEEEDAKGKRGSKKSKRAHSPQTKKTTRATAVVAGGGSHATTLAHSIASSDATARLHDGNPGGHDVGGVEEGAEAAAVAAVGTEQPLASSSPPPPPPPAVECHTEALAAPHVLPNTEHLTMVSPTRSTVDPWKDTVSTFTELEHVVFVDSHDAWHAPSIDHVRCYVTKSQVPDVCDRLVVSLPSPTPPPPSALNAMEERDEHDDEEDAMLGVARTHDVHEADPRGSNSGGERSVQMGGGSCRVPRTLVIDEDDDTIIVRSLVAPSAAALRARRTQRGGSTQQHVTVHGQEDMPSVSGGGGGESSGNGHHAASPRTASPRTSHTASRHRRSSSPDITWASDVEDTQLTNTTHIQFSKDE